MSAHSLKYRFNWTANIGSTWNMFHLKKKHTLETCFYLSLTPIVNFQMAALSTQGHLLRNKTIGLFSKKTPFPVKNLFLVRSCHLFVIHGVRYIQTEKLAEMFKMTKNNDRNFIQIVQNTQKKSKMMKLAKCLTSPLDWKVHILKHLMRCFHFNNVNDRAGIVQINLEFKLRLTKPRRLHGCNCQKFILIILIQKTRQSWNDDRRQRKTQT